MSLIAERDDVCVGQTAATGEAGEGRFPEPDAGWVDLDVVAVLPVWVLHDGRRDLGVLSDAEVMARLRRIDEAAALAEVRRCEVLHEIRDRGLDSADGYRSRAGMVRAVTGCSTRASHVRVETADLVEAHPAVIGALEAGELLVEQCHDLARVAANGRVAGQLGGVLDTLLTAAANLDADRFRLLLARWEHLADADGSAPGAEVDHDRRSLLVREVAGVVHLDGRFAAVQGAQLIEALRRYRHAEWHADWECTVAVHGDQACARLMPRTDRQRSADAMIALVTAATTPTTASTTPTSGGGAPRPAGTDPLVDVVVDLATLERTLVGQLASSTTGAAGLLADALHDLRRTAVGRLHAALVAATLQRDAHTALNDRSPPDTGVPAPPGTGPPARGHTDADGQHRPAAEAGIRPVTNSGEDPAHPAITPDAVTGTRVAADAGADAGPDGGGLDGRVAGWWPAPVDPGRARCETSSGIPLAPAEALAAIVLGRLRMILVDHHGVAISVGHRQRLFNRHARTAIAALEPTCIWPGCRVATTDSQLDHILEHRHGGPTTLDNLAPLCRAHNHYKTTHGYRIRHQPDGTWHILRPNGTALSYPTTANRHAQATIRYGHADEP